LTNSKDTTADEVDATVVFSSQKSQFADYTTWKGIETKTGIEPEDAVRFLVKELLDNALDYLESSRQQNNEQQPQIHVIVEKHKEKYIRITVHNSNYVYDIADNGKSKAAFSKQMLKNVFDFDRYHSSKCNQFKITKGALGDALKEVLCIPHVLARDDGIADWNYPLYIISQQQKLYQIEIIIDRINQTVRSKIDESDFDKTASIDIQQRYHPNNNNDTQVILTVPIINDDDYQAELYTYVSDYAMFAIHVKLTFEDKNTAFFVWNLLNFKRLILNGRIIQAFTITTKRSSMNSF
jgi:hypothetical protein